MRKEYRKLWQILTLLWDPLHLAGHTDHHFSPNDLRLIQEVFYLFQWATATDLGYRYQMSGCRTRIGSLELEENLLGFEDDPDTDRIAPPKRLLEESESLALRRFAQIWDHLPKRSERVISTRKFIAMIAHHNYLMHVNHRKPIDVDREFDQKYRSLNEEKYWKLVVQREHFLGLLYVIATECHDSERRNLSKS